MKNIGLILSFMALCGLNQFSIQAIEPVSLVPQQFVVRAYQQDTDKEAVLKLCQESSYELGYTGEDIAVSDFETCHVLVNNGNVIGFSMSATFGDEGHIRTLAIFKEFRNMGFGKTLLEGVIETLRSQGALSVFVSVYEDRIDGGNFWIKQGFEILKDSSGEIVSIGDGNMMDPEAAKNVRMMNGYTKNI